MKTNKQFKLIDGHFSAKDAKELLENLYSRKIHFHQMKNFSSMERFGIDDEMSTKRIPELKESLKMLSEVINEAIIKNLNLKITSLIEIDFLDDIKES